MAKNELDCAFSNAELSNNKMIAHLKARFDEKIETMNKKHAKQSLVIENLQPVVTSVAIAATLSLIISALRFLRVKI